MTLLFLETATSRLLFGDILPTILFLIISILAIIYGTTLDISGGKSRLLTRYKSFKIRSELVNIYPGLRRYPLLGSFPELAYLSYKPCRDFVPTLQSLAQSYGPIFRFWNLYQPKLVITCPKTAIASLKDNSFPGRTSESVEIGKAIGGEGLILLPPDIHGERKKMWRQWFTLRIINGNLEIFKKEAIRLSEELSKETNKTFDFVDYALHCTFRIVACSAFGEEYVNNIPETSTKEIFRGVTTLSINLVTRIFRPWLANDFIYFNLTADGRQSKRCIKRSHKLTHDAMKNAKVLRTNNVALEIAKNVPCFLDYLLDIHERGDLTEYEVFQELNNFIVGAYDTTGLSLSWTLYLLALNPECQTKIVNELSEIFGRNIKKFSSEVTPEHLQNMRYLELCIKESLRFYPAFALLLRRSTDNKVVRMPDGNIIPSGVDMYIPLRIVHQNPEYFPEPEKFIPERHLVSIPAYLPFGLGSRSCVGQVYAMQELKMILAYLLMEYKWETPEKPNLEPLTVPVSYPENGIRFKILKRCII